MGCAPTKIKTANYDPNETKQLNNTNQSGMVYYLPKKYLKLEVTFNIFYHIKSSAYSDNRKPTQYKIIEEYLLIRNVKLEEKILPDANNSVFIKLDNAKQSGNDLDATIQISPEGFLTSIKTVSEGKVGQVFDGLISSASTLVRLGSSLALPGSGILGGRDVDEGPNLYKYSVDSITQTYTKLLEINGADTTIKIKAKDFMPKITNGPEILVKIMGEAIKDKIPQNPLKSNNGFVEGVLYRLAAPIRTIVEIRGNQNDLARVKTPSSTIVIDDYISYPQFGAYGIAQLNISGSGRQETNVSFYPQGGLQTYSIDKKSKAEENAAQRAKVLDNLENSTLDLKYGNKEKETKRKQDAEAAKLKLLEEELELEEKKAALEEKKMKLDEKKKNKGN